jgi:hypothetical protein
VGVCGFEIGPISDAARRYARRVRCARSSCVSGASAHSAHSALRHLRIPVSRRQCDQVRTAGRGVRALVGRRFQTDSTFRYDVGAGPRRLAPAWRVCRIRSSLDRPVKHLEATLGRFQAGVPSGLSSTGVCPGEAAVDNQMVRIRVGVISRELVSLSFLPVGYGQGLCNVVSAGTCHAGSPMGT